MSKFVVFFCAVCALFALSAADAYEVKLFTGTVQPGATKVAWNTNELTCREDCNKACTDMEGCATSSIVAQGTNCIDGSLEIIPSVDDASYQLAYTDGATTFSKTVQGIYNYDFKEGGFNTQSYLATIINLEEENVTFTGTYTYVDVTTGSCSYKEECKKECNKKPAPPPASSSASFVAPCFAAILLVALLF